jgi:hypothetical protein
LPGNGPSYCRDKIDFHKVGSRAAASAFKERRFGQPSISKPDGWEAVIPWATPALHYLQLWCGLR